MIHIYSTIGCIQINSTIGCSTIGCTLIYSTIGCNTSQVFINIINMRYTTHTHRVDFASLDRTIGCITCRVVKI